MYSVFKGIVVLKELYQEWEKSWISKIVKCVNANVKSDIQLETCILYLNGFNAV